MSCRRARRRIDAFFQGTLNGARWRRLAEHLKGCEGCLRCYNRVVLAMRQMSGRPGEVTAEELAPIGDAIALLRPFALPAVDRLLWPAAALAACLVAVGGLWLWRADRRAGEVGVRGGAAALDATIRAFCVREQGSARLDVVAVSSADTGELSCAHRDLVQFAYALRSSRPAFLYLAAVDESGRTFDYYPRPPATESLPIFPARSEEPLPGSIRLSVNHRPGQVRIVAVVSERPMTRDAVAPLLAGSAGGRERAPPGARVLRLALEITP